MQQVSTDARKVDVSEDAVKDAVLFKPFRDAMLSGARQTIAGIPGKWSESGERWTADDPTGTDTVVLVRISSATDEEVGGVARQVAEAAHKAEQTGARPRLILAENDTSAFKRRKIQLPNGKSELRTVRPMFREALSLLGKRGIRRLLAYDLDRTFRDPRDLEDTIDVVEASSPRVVCDSVTGSLRLANDADITMARVLVAFANKSSRDTARRVALARQEQAQEGRNGGGRRAYGWEADGITPRAEEIAWIQAAFERAESGVSMKEVTRDLNAEGSRTADGKKWTGEGVRDMLLRPRNAGLAVYRQGERGRRPYKRDEVVGRYPGEAPVSEDRYWSMVAKLTDPDRRTNPGTPAKWFGSGIYRCPCGNGLRVKDKLYRSTYKGRVTSERRVVVYRCQQTGPGHVIIRQAELDALVIKTLQTMIRESAPEEIIGAPQPAGVDPAALRKEIARHKERLLEIAADYEADEITKAQRNEMTAKRRVKLEAAKEKLDAYNADTHPAAKLIGVADIQAAWDALSFGEKREVLRRLLTVEVQRVGRGRRPQVHERVRLTPIKPTTEPTSQPTGDPHTEPATVTALPTHPATADQAAA